MRAPFNDQVNLLDGPGTATPGFPRVLNANCRFVPDPFFKDWDFPLRASEHYFTITSDLPIGPTATLTAPGVFSYDFNQADTAVFHSIPLLFWTVLRVELCTRPGPGAPYWRASVTNRMGPPTECQSHYTPRYQLRNLSTGTITILSQVSATRWTNGIYELKAETTPTGAFCVSVWQLLISTVIDADASYNGTNTVGFEDTVTHAITWQVDPLP